MKSLEFFRNVSIGQYASRESPLHRLTPVTKYLWLFALAIPGAAAGPLGLGLVFLLGLGLGCLAGLPPTYLLRGAKPALPFFFHSRLPAIPLRLPWRRLGPPPRPRAL